MIISSKQHFVRGHRIEITKVEDKFLVWIDGHPCNRPNAASLPEEEKQARFSSARVALRAAEVELNWRRRRII